MASCRNPKAVRCVPTSTGASGVPVATEARMLFHSACESVDRAKQLTFPAPSCFVLSARTRAVHKNGRMPTFSAAKVSPVGIGWRQANFGCGPLCRILVSRRWSANHTTSNRQSKQRAATEETMRNPDRRTILTTMASLALASSMARITVAEAASDPALSPALGEVDQALR